MELSLTPEQADQLGELLSGPHRREDDRVALFHRGDSIVVEFRAEGAVSHRWRLTSSNTVVEEATP